jgi:hypothetical protein
MEGGKWGNGAPPLELVGEDKTGRRGAGFLVVAKAGRAQALRTMQGACAV